MLIGGRGESLILGDWCPKWVAMARQGLPMGGNESRRLQEAFKTPPGAQNRPQIRKNQEKTESIRVYQLTPDLPPLAAAMLFLYILTLGAIADSQHIQVSGDFP